MKGITAEACFDFRAIQAGVIQNMYYTVTSNWWSAILVESLTVALLPRFLFL